MARVAVICVSDELRGMAVTPFGAVAGCEDGEFGSGNGPVQLRREDTAWNLKAG
jgi:hypothetical protein